MTDAPTRFRTCAGYGGRRSDGAPCGRTAGWGTDEDTGRCRDHRDRRRSGKVVGRIDAEDGEDLPPAPSHLSDAAAARWQALVEEWLLGTHQLLLLEEGLAAWDRVREARRVLREEGPTVTNPSSGHVSRHPAARELDQSLTQLRQVFKQLDLQPPEVP